MDVVFACTGNICRSPMAEAILRDRLASRAPEVAVGSVGLRFDGRGADPHAVKALARRGIDLSGFRSRIMTPDLLAGSSVLLGMERLHVREAAVLAPGLFERSFTLPEFVTAAADVGPRGAEDLSAWARRVGAGRIPLDYVGDDPRDEVADPIGRSGRAFRACAARLDELIDRFVTLAWPLEVTATVPTGTVPAPPPHRGGL